MFAFVVVVNEKNIAFSGFFDVFLEM